MSSSILVAYATRGGSTGEVAVAVAAALREAGNQVQLARAQDLKEIGACDEVVLGAPLYMGRIPREMHRFLAANRAALLARRSWVFILGTVKEVPADFEAARRQAEKQLLKYEWLKPAELKIFGGRFDFTSIGFPFSLLRGLPAFKEMRKRAMDIRDWDAIHNWALSVGHRVRPAA